MREKESKNEVSIYKRITRLYIVALAIMAFFLILAQLIIQYTLSRQTRYTEVINTAGRQRMLSQKICKDLLILADINAYGNREYYLNDLGQSLLLWKQQHDTLKKGFQDYEIKVVAENSAQLKNMIEDIDPLFLKLYRDAFQLKSLLQLNQTPSDSSIQTILDTERTFLIKQEAIVTQYDSEAKNRIEKIQRLELLLFFLTIVVIVLEIIFIFRPISRGIKETIEKFASEERKTKLINEELNKNNNTLKEIEKEKRRQQVNEQRVRSASLIQGQEEERKRISKELHDGLGQLLTTLKLSFENISPDSFSSEREKTSFMEGKALIKETINEIRNISFNLMPSVLSDFGIASALKLLCEQVAKNTSKNIIFEDINWIGVRLEKNIEIGLYRITQEALNNAIKYSESEEINVDLELNDGIIVLTITDYGKGFKLNELHPMTDILQNGISNMEERAKMIGGSVKIASNQEEGTKVTAKVPIKYPDHE